MTSVRTQLLRNSKGRLLESNEMMAEASMGVPSGISSREATYAEAVQAASSSRLRREMTLNRVANSSYRGKVVNSSTGTASRPAKRSAGSQEKVWMLFRPPTWRRRSRRNTCTPGVRAGCHRRRLPAAGKGIPCDAVPGYRRNRASSRNTCAGRRGSPAA